MVIFEGKKSSNDIINNDTMSDDEEVASYVPPWYLLDAITHLYNRSCPSVGPSVGWSRVYFRTTKNVISYAPMTTKFDMDQETIKDNS